MAVLRVRLSLLSPIVIPKEGFVLGDALLHAAEVQRRYHNTWLSRRPDVWTDIELPVAKRLGVWAVSCALLPASACSNGIGRGSASKLLPRGLEINVSGDEAFAFKGSIQQWETIHAPEFELIAESEDVDTFVELANELPGMSLGSRNHGGWGRIGALLDILEDPDLDSAILAPDGRAWRTIPARELPSRPTRAVLRNGRTRPPYWYGPEEPMWWPLPDDLVMEEGAYGDQPGSGAS